MPTKITVNKTPRRYTTSFRKKLGVLDFEARMGLFDCDPRFVSKLLQVLHVVLLEIDRRIANRPGWQDRYTEVRVFNLLTILLVKQHVDRYSEAGVKWTRDASRISKFLRAALDIFDDAETELGKQFERVDVKADLARHLWYRLYDYSRAEAEADSQAIKAFFDARPDEEQAA